VVLPAALPGILTGAILGLSRAAGETAPIMFTAAVFFTPTLPTSPFSKIMALPYHIYVLATAGTNIEATPLDGEYARMTREQRICSDGKSVNYFWAVMKDARFMEKKHSIMPGTGESGSAFFHR
jgi:hypothetical protein